MLFRVVHHICCIILCKKHSPNVGCTADARVRVWLPMVNAGSLRLTGCWNTQGYTLQVWKFTYKWSGWICDGYCSLKPLWLGMREVVPARTSPTLHPHPLPLCCNYPVQKCPSASIVVTSTLRVKSLTFHEAKIVPASTLMTLILLELSQTWMKIGFRDRFRSAIPNLPLQNVKHAQIRLGTKLNCVSKALPWGLYHVWFHNIFELHAQTILYLSQC